MENLDNLPPYIHKYTGNLETYFETGMECMGIIFHDDRGIHEGVDYADATKTRKYHSLAWTLWFGKHCKYYAKIYGPGNDLIYEGPLTRDLKKMKRDRFKLSFIPKEINKRRWAKMAINECRAEIWTNELPDAIWSHQEKFKIWSLVDDLAAEKRGVVIGIHPETRMFWVKHVEKGFVAASALAAGPRHESQIATPNILSLPDTV